MARLSDAMAAAGRDKMSRARRRLDGAAAAIARTDITEGEFDNHFDGVVSAIFHVADAIEIVRTGINRRVGEGAESTVIRSVIATLAAAKISPLPAPARLIDLNSRRNTSVHGHWTEVLDREGLEDAIAAGRELHRAATIYFQRQGVSLTQG